MKIEDKIYTSLCVLFAILVVLGNMIYQKFVALPIFPFYTFELSVGVLIYPMTFFITDLIAEFYGKERANFCVKLAIIMNVIAASIIYGMSSLKATEWSFIDDQTFNKVFGMYGVAFGASAVACYISQNIDVRIYLRLKTMTNNRYLWLRNNVSTAISLLIDTSIVISLMCFFGAIPLEQMGLLIFNGYIFKLLFVISSTPLFYICVALIGRLRSTS